MSNLYRRIEVNWFEAQLNIVRWDGVIHTVKSDPPQHFTIDKQGSVISEPFTVRLTCDYNVKLYWHSKNRFTAEPVTCLHCFVKGDHATP